MKNAPYIAYFVDDPKRLLTTMPITLTGKDLKVFAHHITVEYMPETVAEGMSLGLRQQLLIYGRAKTDSIEALLVKSPDGSTISKNTHPHITMASTNGTSPVESNRVIDDALTNGTIEYFSPSISIDTTLGYFDGDNFIFDTSDILHT